MPIALLIAAAMVALPIIVFAVLGFAARKPMLTSFPARGVQPRRSFHESI